MTEGASGEDAADGARPADDGDGEMASGPITGKPDPILRAEGMRKSFGGLVATDDVTFEVERGTITGLIGPNGAGKSTLFNLVSGFYDADAGTVTVREAVEGDDGTEIVEHDVSGMEPHARAQHGMVRTFQTPRKPEGMTVREAMLSGPQDQLGESIVSLFTSPSEVRAEESQSLERAEAMLERFEIDHLASSLATDLSGGQMKLVELARAMMADPDVLLLDEPVAGVNPTLANKLATFIERLNEEGITFLIIEHDMSFIMRLADPIIVLDQGSVLGEGPPEAVRTDDRVVDAYLGGPDA